MSRVLVDVEPTLWQRVKVKALERGVKLPEAVGQALRGWLSFEGGSVAPVTEGQPPAAERGGPPNHNAEDVAFAEVVPSRPTKDQLQALVDAVPADRPQRRVENRQSYGESPEDLKDAERRRIARQDHLRTHPEDEAADPEVDF